MYDLSWLGPQIAGTSHWLARIACGSVSNLSNDVQAKLHLSTDNPEGFLGAVATTVTGGSKKLKAPEV